MATIRTGKFLAKETLAELEKQHREALATPVMVVTQRHLGPAAKDEATLAIERFSEALNKAAVAAGLPEPAEYEGDTVNYGCDYTTGEILGWKPDE